MDKLIGIICILVAVGAAFYGGMNYERARRQAELAKSLTRIKTRKHFNGRS
jgi:uncharacterized membrane protein YidH (DUF202 family)